MPNAEIWGDCDSLGSGKTSKPKKLFQKKNFFSMEKKKSQTNLVSMIYFLWDNNLKHALLYITHTQTHKQKPENNTFSQTKHTSEITNRSQIKLVQ